MNSQKLFLGWGGETEKPVDADLQNVGIKRQLVIRHKASPDFDAADAVSLDGDTGQLHLCGKVGLRKMPLLSGGFDACAANIFPAVIVINFHLQTSVLKFRIFCLTLPHFSNIIVLKVRRMKNYFEFCFIFRLTQSFFVKKQEWRDVYEVFC